MKTNRVRTISSGKAILFFMLCAFLASKSYSQCAYDIYIANDQSGSVDSRENMQSRQFVERLALAFPLGNANTESRIAISSWSWNTEFQQYNFPLAGIGYTTAMSDIVNYRNSPKPFNGETDPYAALLKAYQNINLTPVAGRNVPKLIILMTDAYSYQVNSNIISLADQVKAAGYKILVMGVDAASNNPPQPILQAVASPGLNFTASSYESLITNAVATVQQAIVKICPSATPPFDLTVTINSFNCNTGNINYTVSNTGGQSFGPAVLSVSFYNGNPKLNTTSLLATHSQAGITIGSNSSATYSFSNVLFSGVKNVYAVVNLSTSGTNARPALPANLSGRLQVAGEGNANNNFSDGFAGTGCSKAVIQVSNTGLMGCNNTANYQVQVCNTGSANATIQDISSLPAAGFVLESVQTLSNPCSNLNIDLSRSWGTYLGGTSSDYVKDMATDAAGNIYIAGRTASAAGIATAGTFDNSYNGSTDGFVAKFNAAGVLQWSTYLGGTAQDYCRSIAVDGSGNVYVAGITNSTTGIASAGAFQAALAGAPDGFLMKFNGANGTRLWGTYCGVVASSADDGQSAVTVTGNDIYFATTATQAGSLATNGTTHAALTDIVVTKFNASGGRIWTTIFGGPGSERMDWGEVVANASSVYVTGFTRSASGIASGNYWDNTRGGPQDGLIARFDPANGNVVWATYVGGVGSDELEAMVIEPSGNLLAGVRDGANSTLFRFDPSGGAPINSFTLPAGLYLSDIATDASGNIYLGGNTSVAGFGTPDAYQPTLAGGEDLFVARYTSTFTLEYFSYYGDTGDEPFFGYTSILPDAFGNIMLGGATSSNPSTVLATPGAHQVSTAGNDEGIIAKFAQPETIGVLPAGCCIQLNYTYNTSAATNGTHNNSIGVTAVKVTPTDDNPVILPNNNFTVPGYAGTYNGFNGAANTSDNVVKATPAVCTTPASPVTVAISSGSASGCSQSFSKATITITNPNTSISFTNAKLLLNLTGAGSVFSGEPYNLSTGLLLPSLDISSPNYPSPGLPGQLNGMSGQQYLTLYSLPTGTSSFDIDIALGTGATNLSVTGQDLPLFYNPGGITNTATGAGFAAPASKPTITLNCPGNINAGSTISMSGTTAGAATVQWASSTAGNLSNTGNIAAPQTMYTPAAMDLVNGYVDISLTAVSSGGCDDVRVCRVLINNVQRDFGDAPTSFDLGTTQQPLAAASTKLSGLYLGVIDPDMESTAQPSVACNGDGTDEEGLRYYPAKVASQFSMVLDVEITNNSSKQGYLVAYIDWNEDGDFLDTDEQSTTVTIPSLTGAAIYRPSFNIPFAAGPITTYVRLRLSSDADAIRVPYGASPEGEVEDYVVDITVLPVELINFQAAALGKQVILSWQTATETSNDHFDIERSANGSGWQKIGTMNGYGNSSQLQTYSFTDHQPYNKSNYYRLKQVNSDGSFGYSPVRRINFESTVVITRVYPNPVKDQLHIVSNSGEINYDVSITNISGQEVLRKNKMVNESTIAITHLPAGVYIVKLSHKEEQPEYYKVIKQ